MVLDSLSIYPFPCVQETIVKELSQSAPLELVALFMRLRVDQQLPEPS